MYFLLVSLGNYQGLLGIMNIISWNYRGLGHLRVVPILHDLIQTHQSDVLFLSETLVLANKIDEVRLKLGFHAIFVVDRIGRSCWVALVWRHPFSWNVLNYSSNFINMEVV